MIKILPPNDQISSSKVYKSLHGSYSHTNKTGSAYSEYTLNYNFGKAPDLIVVQNNSAGQRLVEDFHRTWSTNGYYGYHVPSISSSTAKVRVYNLNTSSTQTIFIVAFFIFSEEEILAL